MPTVQLGRLQQEAARLSEHFSDPKAYLAALENMLETYAAHVHRQGRVKGMRPVLFSFEVPQPVLKRLHLEMALQARQFPDAALAVADALWARRTIDTRLLAARLLGATPATDPQELIRRLHVWAEENREETLTPELYAYGILSLIQLFPQELLTFAGQLLASGEARKQILGLGILKTLLSEGHFNNLPAIFGLLSEISKDPPKKLRPQLAELLILLAKRSPNEALYFLQQRLAETPTEGAQWVTRQVMKELPEESSQRLREALK